MNRKPMTGSASKSSVNISFITKKDLCYRFGLVSPSGRLYSDKLKDLFFTDVILRKLKMTVDDYNKVKTFTFAQSQIIANEFGLYEEA
jgi:hypothetical protein